MRFLKKVWDLWSDIATFAWLERLGVKHPRLARAIAGSIVGIAFALIAWYYLDRRFIIYSKGSDLPLDWSARRVWGVLFGIAGLVAAFFTVWLILPDSGRSGETPLTAPPSPPRKTGPISSPQKKMPLPPRSARPRKNRSR
jgi:hypothetical protein